MFSEIKRVFDCIEDFFKQKFVSKSRNLDFFRIFCNLKGGIAYFRRIFSNLYNFQEFYFLNWKENFF